MSLFKKERLKILGYANHISSRPIWAKKRFYGFTLIELLIVIAILGTLSAIAVPAYHSYIEKARITRAIAEISILHKQIVAYDMANGDLPNKLDDIGRKKFLDPWGNKYEYLNFATIKGKGKMRKDQFGVALNSDYDLYSKGKDGKSKARLTDKKSHDDIVRANDGTFIGLASQY